MSNLHSGFSAVVTGGNSGIGRATAERLLLEGAQVLVVDQHSEPTWTHNALSYLQTDVADAASADLIIQQVIENTGRLDYLVNNAGMVGGESVETMEFEIWQRIIDVNLNAVLRLSKAAIPHLKVSPRGRIVNIGSIMSQLAGSGMAAYTASKHAIAGLTKTLALELGPHKVTANYIQPGAIVTGITAPAMSHDPTFTTFWEGKSALGRLGQPKDIANAINFLLTDDADFITAHGLTVDGGVMVNP